MGAACAWRAQAGWTGRRFRLGSNKEVFDDKVFAIYQALRTIEQRNERGRQYTVFFDSTSAITRVRDDDLGPGQRFAVAAIEVCARITANDNSVTIRWVPAHSGATGNEVADQYAKSAATGEDPVEAIPEGYAVETSLSHMTGVATEARSRETREWITAHVRPERRYMPPPGRGLRRSPLRRARKTLAGRYYQLLSGHADTGTHRKRFGRTDTADCWWCMSGEPQSRHHLFTRCPSWTEQRRRLWKDVGEACEWEHPRTPSVRLLWDTRAAGAVLEFLRTTRAGCIGVGRVPPEDRGEETDGEEGGQGPPKIVSFLCYLLGEQYSSLGWGDVSFVFL